MLRTKDIGWGLASLGLLIVINAGLSVDAAAAWDLLGLVLVLFGTVLIYLSKSRT